MDKFRKWQEQGISNKKRILALAAGALIFPITIPVLLIFILPLLDKAFGIGSFFHGAVNIAAGIAAVISGGTLAMWAVVIQITRAAGTPFPMMPTQKLLISGPFKYCRNPMTLGTVLAYGGVAVWVGSFSSAAFVAVFAAALLCYLKLVEEKELLIRFGSEYLEYKRKTPFILPIKITRSNVKES